MNTQSLRRLAHSLFCASAATLRRLEAALERPWLLDGVMMLGLFAAIAFAFREVLPTNVFFLAPDAPLTPLSFREAWAQLASPAPAVLNLFRLFPIGIGYELSFWADMVLCALAAVFLLRGYALPRGAAWVGGYAAAFMGYFSTLFCAGHRGVVDAIAVTCWAFGLLHRALQHGQKRWFIALGLTLPLGLAAQADIWFLLMLGVIAYGLTRFIGRCRAEGLPATLRALWPGLLCTLLCLALTGIPALRHTFGAAQATRTAQFQSATAETTSPAAERAARWRFITDWSLPPEDCLEFLKSDANGYTSYRFDPQPYTGRMGSARQVLRQHSIHIGVITLLLALLACTPLAMDSTRKIRWFWAGLALISLVLAFGKYTPLYRLIWELPGVHQIRAPVKWLHLTGFSIAVLAGCGAAVLVKRRSSCALLLCLAIALQGCSVIPHYLFPLRFPTEADYQQLPPGARLLAPVTCHDLLRARGFVPVTDPRTADAALLMRPRARGFAFELILPETLHAAD